MARRLRLVPAGIALLALAAALVPAAPAASRPCGVRVLDDWYDGRIDRVYAPECYAAALEALPEDVRAYSTAEEDINQALRQRLTGPGAKPAAKQAPEQPAEASAAPQPPAPSPAEAEQPEPSPRSLAGRAPDRDAAQADEGVAALPAAEHATASGRPPWVWAAAGFAAVLVAAAVPLALRRWRRAGA